MSFTVGDTVKSKTFPDIIGKISDIYPNGIIEVDKIVLFDPQDLELIAISIPDKFKIWVPPEVINEKPKDYTGKRKCSCTMEVIWRDGCKCGGC